MNIKELLGLIFCCVYQPKESIQHENISNSSTKPKVILNDSDDKNKSSGISNNKLGKLNKKVKEDTENRENTLPFHNAKDIDMSSSKVDTIKDREQDNEQEYYEDYSNNSSSSSASGDSEVQGTDITQDMIDRVYFKELTGSINQDEGWILSN